MIKSRLHLISSMRIILKPLSLNSQTITIIKSMASLLLIKKTPIQGWMSKFLTHPQLIMGRKTTTIIIVIHLECKEQINFINNLILLQTRWNFCLTIIIPSNKMDLIPHRCTPQITTTRTLPSHTCSLRLSLRTVLVFLIIFF